MILLRLFLLVAVAVCASEGLTAEEEMQQAKSNEMYNCFFGILCKARKPKEFRRIMLKAHPKLIQEGFKWLKEISDIDAEDTDEFWNSYPDYKCPLPEETKQEYFFEWLHRLGEYWAEACIEAESEECIMMAAAENEYNIVSAEYTANGICSAQATELGQEKMKDGEEMLSGGGMPSMGK